ncbi:hypothetical protein BHM03_00034982 [Ensete ventricosum]|nr:hypothetical protein BHM03_00034982 [Ensete ventricosum]
MGNCSLISHCLLQVNVPGNNSFNVVTVRCGLCASLLSVDLEALLGKLPHQSFQKFLHLISASSYCKQQPRSDVFHLPITSSSSELLRSMSSSYCSCILLFREEIRRLKAKDPDISHKEAFSTAAKNWAHFPEIHFGPSVKRSKQV